MAGSFLPAFSSAPIFLCANMCARHGLLPVLHDMLEIHICTLLYIFSSATSPSGYVQQGFKKPSNNQYDSSEQGVCAGKADQRPRKDALLYCRLNMALPALLLLQRAELGADVLVDRPCTFIHWKVVYFGGLLCTESVTAAVADLVFFYSLNE